MKDDDIYEILSFSAPTLDSAFVEKIETYLGVKYGLPLAHNYKNDAGQDVYQKDGKYDHNIFGLGREDSTSLHQKVAKAVDSVDCLG